MKTKVVARFSGCNVQKGNLKKFLLIITGSLLVSFTGIFAQGRQQAVYHNAQIKQTEMQGLLSRAGNSNQVMAINHPGRIEMNRMEQAAAQTPAAAATCNEDSIHYFTWDTVTNRWQLTKREFRTYDANHRPVNYLGLEWNGSAWVVSYKYDVTYDANGNATNYLYQNWNGTAWVNYRREIYTYNANNYEINYVEQFWNGSAWVTHTQTTYTYNANNNLTSAVYQIWNGTACVNDQKYLYTYDANNNLTNNIYQSWNGTAWVNNYQYTITYDVNNNQTGRIDQTWNGTAWVNLSRYTYTYDVNNNQISYLVEHWNGTSWENYYLGANTYDANHNLISSLGETWNGIGWQNTGLYAYTYDANHNYTSFLYQSWNGSGWENGNHDTATYDVFNNQTCYIFMQWSGTAWENVERYTSTFDADNNQTGYSYLQGDGNGAWISGDSIHWYSCRSACSVSINPPASVQFCQGDSVELTASAQGGGGGGTPVLDQSQTVYNGGTSARTLAGYSEWQSFTAGITGTMTQLDIGFFTLINGVGQLKIFAGSGTAGTLLWSQQVSVVCGGGNCLLPFTVSVPVTAGQVYTFHFIPGAGMPDPYGIQVAVPGPYAGGEMNIVDPSGTYPTGFDMVFNTYVNGGGSSLAYLWSNGSVDSVTHAASGGMYYVTVTESVGCTAVDSILISEDVLSLSANPTHTTCGNSNGSVVLNVTGGILPFAFDWNNGQHNDTISNLGSGTYFVTVTDTLGCSVTGSAVVNSSNAISVSITEDNAVICASDSARICATAGFNTYLWNIGGTDTCVTVNNAGNYYVTVTDVNGCTAESNHVAVDVYPQPSVSISVNGDTLTAYNAVTYQWYRNGSSINNAVSNIYIAQQGGSYTVAVTDSNGCGATSSAVVISGIDNLSGEDVVSVYPNPLADGGWQLSVGSNMIGSTVEILDADGRNVFKSEIRNSKSEIATNVAKGIYLLRVSSVKNSIVTKLIRL